jgi:N-methylhydantoinase B
MTALLVPVSDVASRSAFLKLGARAYLVISIAMVAAVAEFELDGRITSARIVVGACSEVPQRLPVAEARLIGRVPSRDLGGEIEAADLAALTPIDDVRASAAYRRDAALILVRRAVEALGA